MSSHDQSIWDEANKLEGEQGPEEGFHDEHHPFVLEDALCSPFLIGAHHRAEYLVHMTTSGYLKAQVFEVFFKEATILGRVLDEVDLDCLHLLG